MATLPNTNVLDVTDTTTLNLLQQAFNLANLSNNPTVSAQIAAAAQALTLSGNVGSANLFSVGTGTTPGQTGGGTPVGPTVTIPTTTQQGGFTTPTVGVGGGTTTTTTSPIGIGTPTTVGGTRGGTTLIGTPGVGGPATPVQPGTPGTGVVNTCPNPTYRLGKLSELKVGSSYTSNPDFANLLNRKTCVLIAEVFKCCNGVETFIGYTELGRSTSSEFYESCPDGSKRAVVEEYYSIENLGPTAFVLNKLDNLGLNTVADSSALARQESENLWKQSWGDGCIPKNIYTTFSEYFSSKFVTGITIGDESRMILQSVPIYADVNRNLPRVVASNIQRAIKASCGAKGDCVTVQTGGGGGGTTKICPPDLPGNYTVEVPNSKVMIPYTETILSTATTQTTIPDQKCYVGNEQTYSFEEGYTVTKAIVCSDGSYLNTKTERIITRSGTGKRWINPIKSYDGPECQCIEVAHPNDSYTDPSDPCGCHELLTETIYIVCPDEPNYPNIGPNSKKSTKVYNLPSEPGVRLVSKIKRADCTDDPIRIYHPLLLGKDIINGKVKGITKGLFNLSQSLDCYYTSSTQNTASKSHYYEITDCDSCGKTPYFAVAYGNQLGSGSLYSQGELFDTTTKAVYSQYRLLALEAPERFFKFYTNGQTNPNTKDIYVINYYRNGLSDRLDPGNFEISLAELRGGSYANNVFTGSNVAVSSSNNVITLIDNSGDRSDTTSCSEDPYVSYDIVSGSLNGGIHDSGTGSIDTNPNITTYGTVYPNLGIIVLDPYKLNTQLGFNTVTGSNISGDNAFKLHTAISGAAALGNPMKARNVKYKTTNHYFVRVPAPQANYSNNPTYVTDSTLPEDAGKFAQTCFQKDPQTYITTVGLYNNNRDLIAVAKLSRPVKKTSDNDVLIKIRLNW